MSFTYEFHRNHKTKTYCTYSKDNEKKYTCNVRESHQITRKRAREERNRETIKTTRKQVTK